MRFKLICILFLTVCLCPALMANDSGEPAGPFDGSWAETAWTVAAFLILLFVLWKLVWKKIIAGLQDREGYITKQVTDAEQVRKDAEKVLADYNAKLAGVDDEGKRLIAAHTKHADDQGRELIAKANAEVEKIKIKGGADVERAMRVAEEQLLVKSGEIVLNLGQELLGRSMTDQDHQKLIDQAIDRLKQEHQASGE